MADIFSLLAWVRNGLRTVLERLNMPYKFETDKTPIPRKHDRRVKLTDKQREEIRNAQGKSQRQLAAEYGVSRRTIQFIRDPEKHRENLLRRQERGGSARYYEKEKHKTYMADHRHYKQSLKLKGEL